MSVKFRKRKTPVDEERSCTGSYDFLGLNQYASSLVKYQNEPDIGIPSYDSDMGTLSYRDPSWEKGASDWLYVVPWGIKKALKWIHKNYNSPEIIITENGYSDHDGTLEDDKRISYIQSYLSNTLDAIHEDGVKVTGYALWSFLDNFEWYSGYTEKFGLYQVDFKSKNRTRIAKKSVGVYQRIIESRRLN